MFSTDHTEDHHLITHTRQFQKYKDNLIGKTKVRTLTIPISPLPNAFSCSYLEQSIKACSQKQTISSPDTSFWEECFDHKFLSGDNPLRVLFLACGHACLERKFSRYLMYSVCRSFSCWVGSLARIDPYHVRNSAGITCQILKCL